MAHLTEGSPIRKVQGIEIAASPDAERIARLEQKFPGKVELIPAGSMLFHMSRDLRGLVNRGVFDYKMANNKDGGIYFSDLCALDSNCAVEVSSDLAMYRFDALSDDELFILKSLGLRNQRIGGANIGFDGQTFFSSDPYTEISQGIYGTEIVIFKPSLRKLGKITTLIQLPHPLSLRR